MKTRLTVALLSVAIATQAFSGKAAATIVNLDELDIGRSGTTILDDSFDRNTTSTGGSGRVVPSGASFTDGTPANWFVQGSSPITTANNGQARQYRKRYRDTSAPAEHPAHPTGQRRLPDRDGPRRAA